MAVDQAGERLLVAGLQARQQLVFCRDREPPSQENEK
jgi:hypothetical protein